MRLQACLETTGGPLLVHLQEEVDYSAGDTDYESFLATVIDRNVQFFRLQGRTWVFQTETCACLLLSDGAHVALLDIISLERPWQQEFMRLDVATLRIGQCLTPAVDSRAFLVHDAAMCSDDVKKALKSANKSNTEAVDACLLRTDIRTWQCMECEYITELADLRGVVFRAVEGVAAPDKVTGPEA